MFRLSEPIVQNLNHINTQKQNCRTHYESGSSIIYSTCRSNLLIACAGNLQVQHV